MPWRVAFHLTTALPFSVAGPPFSCSPPFLRAFALQVVQRHLLGHPEARVRPLLDDLPAALFKLEASRLQPAALGVKLDR
jgi:hypothetical protein